MKPAVKLLITLIALTTVSGCNGGSSFLTIQENGWFKDEERGLVYCKANNLKTGADPVCFEAAIKIIEEKS